MSLHGFTLVHIYISPGSGFAAFFSLAILFPGSWGLEIQGLGPGIQGPGPVIQGPGLVIQGPGPVIQDLELRGLDSGVFSSRVERGGGL